MKENGIVTGAGLKEDYDPYPDYLESLKKRFDSVTSEKTSLFTTNVKELFDLFLVNLPVEVRQEYTCDTCRKFVDSYGGLVVISEDGNIDPALWDEKAVPEFFVDAVTAMKNAVLKSEVNGVFLTDKKILGKEFAGEWRHMSVKTSDGALNRSKLDTAPQIMAEKSEDFRLIASALSEYPVEAIKQAVKLLKSGALYRSEKFLGMAEWFSDLDLKCSVIKNNRNRDHILWLAVAKAPAGFCHIKTSMIGTLLDDIVAGLPLRSIKNRFAEKTHLLLYQRPQAAPAKGNIVKAEKIVEKLDIQKSLVRRYARFDEIPKIWVPAEDVGVKGQGAGVFSHIITKAAKEKEQINDYLPETTMTWVKFTEDVLPDARSAEYLIRDGLDSFGAIVTAYYDEAPPIILWDDEEDRNPFSWYVQTSFSTISSPPDDWNLTPGYRKVNGICYCPNLWKGKYEHIWKGIFIILDGAKHLNYKNLGNALLPEILKPELRQVRSTIEAYSNSAELEGHDESSACGIRLQYGVDWDVRIRVTTDLGQAVYKLDRWE